MLDARYVLLHKALDLGPMWLGKAAHLLKEDVPVNKIIPSPNSIPVLPTPIIKEQTHARKNIVGARAQLQNMMQTGDKELETQIKLPETANENIATKIDTQNKDLATLAKDSHACHACELFKCRRQAIFAQGNPHAQLMVLSSNPTQEDDLAVQLFYGESGALLSKMLKAIDIEIEETYLTTLVKCAPNFTTKLNQKHINTCESFLNAQIKLVQPKAILALGTGFKKVAQKSELGLCYQNIPFFITPHPARLMRHPKEKIQAWEVLKQLQSFLLTGEREL